MSDGTVERDAHTAVPDVLDRTNIPPSRFSQLWGGSPNKFYVLIGSFSSLSFVTDSPIVLSLGKSGWLTKTRKVLTMSLRRLGLVEFLGNLRKQDSFSTRRPDARENDSSWGPTLYSWRPSILPGSSTWFIPVKMNPFSSLLLVFVECPGVPISKALGGPVAESWSQRPVFIPFGVYIKI